MHTEIVGPNHADRSYKDSAIDQLVLASPLQLVQALSKRWFTVASVAVLAAVMAAVYALVFADKIYVASGRLMIERSPTIYPNSSSLIEPRTLEEPEVVSQAQALVSNDLITTVYKQLMAEGFTYPTPVPKSLDIWRTSQRSGDSPTLDERIAAMRDAIDVKVIDKSRVLVAQFADSNPVLAERALTILFNEYLQREVDRREAANKAARTQYESRLRMLQSELELANGQIVSEAAGSQLYKAGSNTVLSTNIEAAVNQLNDLRAQNDNIAARIKVGEEAVKNENWTEAARVINTPIMQKLLQSELDIEIDSRVGTDGLHTEAYPTNVANKGKLKTLHALMNEELTHALQAMKQNRGELIEQIDQVESRLSALIQHSGREIQGSLTLEQLGKSANALRDMRGIVLERLYDTEVLPRPDAWVLESPKASSKPASPRTNMIVASSTLIGSILGSLFVLWQDSKRRVTRAMLELGSDGKSPLSWSLPMPSRPARRLIDSPAAVDISYGDRWRETLRAIGYRLAQKRALGAVSIAIVSAQPREGKSALAVGLARRLAGDGHKVLLVDADLRRPNIAKLVGLGSKESLGEILQTPLNWKEGIQVDSTSTLHVLAPEEPTMPESGALREGSWRKFFAELGQQYEFLIVDTSPIMMVADGLVIADSVDSAIFVYSNKTSPEQIRLAFEQTGFPQAKLDGIVRMGDAPSYLGY